MGTLARNRLMTLQKKNQLYMLCEICSKLSIKTTERCRSGVFIVTFEQVNVSWVSKKKNQWHMLQG